MKKSLLNMLLIFQKKGLHIFILSSLFWGCVDKETTIINEPQPSTMEKLNALFDDALIGEKQFAHFNAEQGYFYKSAKGSVVGIPPACLRLNGNPVTGTVILEFIELFDRAKMISTNKPTMGLLPNNEQEMMLSGGEFYVNVTQNGQNLTTTSPILIYTPVSNTGGLVTGMKPFKGSITNNNLVWEALNKDVFVGLVEGNKYSLSIPGFGWFNCDKFYNYPDPKTTITANVPSGFANVSQVYLLAKNVPNALGNIGGKFPVGLQCYLMFVTENKGNFMWITKEQTLTANHSVTFDLKDAQYGKKADWQGHVTLLK
jgi:hypothetical protein